MTGAAREEPCPFCREPIPAGAARCPLCEEDLARGRSSGEAGETDAPPRGPRTDPFAQPAGRDVRRGIASASALGFAAGLFIVGAGERILGGPLPDLAAAARSLRFLELAVAALFLLEIARFLRTRG